MEKQGATVEEATVAALAALGVTRENADIEVVSPGRRGLFGGNRPATVRATTRGDDPQAGAEPAAAGAAPDDELMSGQQEDGVTDTETIAAPEGAMQEEGERELSPEERLNQLDQEADIAADFVEGLLDIMDLPGDIEIEVQEEQALLNLSDLGSGLLIGRRGATLDALQELVRSTTQRQTERRSYVRIDVEGYRARQLGKLRDKCRDAIAQVRETGEPVRLEPMDSYERKMMHDLVARTGGVSSSSEGSEPKRRVVIHPAD